jgi:Phosphoribosylglycinamide synthetase, N domain
VKVCVVGSGGREHALAHVLARTAEVVVTPGSPGIPGSVPTPPGEVDADLWVVGPEAWPTTCGPPAGWSSARGPTAPGWRGRRRG